MPKTNTKCILIVDDDPDFVRLVEAELGREGYKVLTAANGREAIDKTLTMKPDLVLLDVMMPGMDGYHVAREINNLTVLGNRTPQIILITCRDTAREKGVAMMSGAEEIIQKPFAMASLHAKLKEILSRRNDNAA